MSDEIQDELNRDTKPVNEADDPLMAQSADPGPTPPEEQPEDHPPVRPIPDAAISERDYRPREIETVKERYAIYIRTISVRSRPNEPLIWDDLTAEKRLGWLRAVIG